ncbi:flavin dependent monooxygenase [Aspergillus bombycis]|uniref:Flavin dependent monooxygenase n=1 Tax=Aspergillus bombycis TaxID=109264 RepID=A0A1F7ZZD3_9EURO|nr:flavin dependent monooxygenase [Aspergillus bombycis]OGM44820.1 flavin dependent monooxygenase [Aspergillus bombycis]
MTISKQIRRVAVIGAGPSGLSAVKYLLAEKYFTKIDVFEKRSSVGGVWNYTPPALKQSTSTLVPQLDPNEPGDEPTWHHTGGIQGPLEPAFISPIYSTLDTNIPKELMAYGDKPFHPDAQVLPKYSTVKKYLDEYAENVKDYIHLDTQVVSVKSSGYRADAWAVTTKNLRTGVDTTDTYDAVVVASGHYDVPYTPDIPGIKIWNETYPGIISHSKLYDSPESFRGKKVIVVGGSASGVDIGNQINRLSKGKVIASQRTESYLMPSNATDKDYVPEIVEFLPPTEYNRAVRFTDGKIEDDVDAIVFCTGYLYSFPFLSSLDHPVITDGRRVLNTYQHLFYIHNPTLAFPVLPQRVIPFPLSENQAAVFARVWSGRLTLPDTAEMKAWEDGTVIKKGDGTAFHLLHFPLDADYMNLLYEWAGRAEPRQGLTDNGNGKQGNYWGERERWMRQLFPEIRRTFVGKGDERHKFKSIEQLGYDFEKYRKEQAHL